MLKFYFAPYLRVNIELIVFTTRLALVVVVTRLRSSCPFHVVSRSYPTDASANFRLCDAFTTEASNEVAALN